GIGEQIENRRLEEERAVEPVVVVAEAMDPVRARQSRLVVAGLPAPQVVEAQIGGKMRLMVARKDRSATHHVGPLRETRAPPPIVLGDRMELRQIERERPQVRRQKLRT